MGHQPIGEVARQLDVSPHLLSNWFYRRVLDHKRCPIVGRQRMIQVDYVPEIKRALHVAGYIVAR
jgi:hypothetical protein